MTSRLQQTTLFTAALGRGARRVLFALALVGAAAAGCSDDGEDTASGGDGQTPDRTEATQAQIDEALAALQEELETLSKEGGDLRPFEARARRFTENHPEEPGGHVLLAQARMALRDWSGALGALDEALKLDPAAQRLHQLAGVCAAKVGNNDEALAHYLAALDGAGDRADSALFADLGRLYIELEDLDKAQQAFERSLDAPPPPDQDTNWKHQGYSGLADVASVRGELDAALQQMRLAITFGRSDSNADVVGYHIQQARIYMDADRDQDAQDTLRSTWSRYPGSDMRIESVRMRARLYERAGQLESAVNYITAQAWVYEQEPDRTNEGVSDFYVLLAEWQIRAGQHELARDSLGIAQEKWPTHPQIAALRERLQ